MNRRNRLNRRLATLGLALIGSVALTGCHLFDGLHARDNLNKGVKAYTNKDYDEAIEFFTKAVELDPGLIDAQLYLAHTFRAQYIPGIPRPENEEKANRAIAEFQKVVDNAETGSDRATNAMASIAGLYTGLGDEESAKGWYRKRIEVDPDNPEPYYGVGTVDHRQAESLTGIEGSNTENLTEEERASAHRFVDEGIEALNKALELKPDYGDAFEYLNLLYRQKSYLATDEDEKVRWNREASELYRRAIRIRREQERQAEKERRMFNKKAGDADN